MEDAALTNSILDNSKLANFEESNEWKDSHSSTNKNNNLNKNLKFSNTKPKYNQQVEFIDFDNLTTASVTLNTDTQNNKSDTSFSNTMSNKNQTNKPQLQSQQSQQQQNSIVTVSEINAKNQNTYGVNTSNSNLNKQSGSQLQAYQTQSSQPKEEKTPEPMNEIRTPKPIKITSRIVFLKLGQVDTRNERYDAEAYIECSWEDDQIFKILSDPNLAKNCNFACVFFFLFYFTAFTLLEFFLKFL